MRLLPFHLQRPMWDEYRAFHVKVGPFVQFDTGEVICTRYNFDRDDYARKLYKDLNVEIRYTADDKCPTLYLPTGEKVAKAWLDDRGSQTLLIDWNHGIAIRLGGTGNAPQYTPKDHWQASIPERFRSKCSAYWAGELSKPVGSAGIKVTRPRKLTEAERGHLAGIQNFARAKWAMEHDGEDVPLPESRWTLMDVDLALKTEPKDVSFNDKCRAVHNGFTKVYDVQKYETLIVKE